MSNLESPEFKIAWAKAVARAAVDEASRQRLIQDPVAVFAEHGFTPTSEQELKDFVSAHLKPALDAIENQNSQQKSQSTSTGSATPFAGAPSSAGIGCLASSQTYLSAAPCSCSSNPTLPCWGAPSSGGPVSGGAGQCAACGCMCGYPPIGTLPCYCWSCAAPTSTQLTGGASSGLASAGMTDAGKFNCLGSIGTVGSFGTVCGCAGSAATAGTFGSAITAVAGGTPGGAIATAACGGATSSTAMGASMAGAGDLSGKLNWWGSAGTFGLSQIHI